MPIILIKREVGGMWIDNRTNNITSENTNFYIYLECYSYYTNKCYNSIIVQKTRKIQFKMKIKRTFNENNFLMNYHIPTQYKDTVS